MTEKKRKAIFCCPTITKPYPQFLDALEASIPLIHAAGWDEGSTFTIGNAYISFARANMLRQALDAKADVIVFLDHDLSWDPADILTLIETPGDVVAGDYRFKDPSKEEYMARLWTDEAGHVLAVPGAPPGCIKAVAVPAGFLKITNTAVARFMKAYPELMYGPPYAPAIDIFNHGARDGVWFGEDFGFSRRWNDLGGDIWLIPDLNITHWDKETPYPGNLHRFLMKQPGGAEDPARKAAPVGYAATRVLDGGVVHSDGRFEPWPPGDPTFRCAECGQTKPRLESYTRRSSEMLGILICQACYAGSSQSAA